VLGLRERGTTIVFSTHDMEMAEKMCDTIFMIFQGKKVLDGTLHSIQSQYHADQVRVRVEHFPADGSANQFGEKPIPAIPGISDITFDGRFHRFLMDHPERKQEILQQLSARRTISHFEVIKPSLHDIFVKIAKPAGIKNDIAEARC
jgi:ABC-2 type transport system ATP-binding protein